MNALKSREKKLFVAEKSFLWWNFVAIFIVFLVFGAEPVPAATRTFTFYVSPKGSDENPGDALEPFRTIEKARKAIRAVPTSERGRCLIMLREGTYELSEPMRFGPEDGGAERFSLVFSSSNGEKATIRGGKTISGWTLLSEGLATAEVPWSVEPIPAKAAEGDKPEVAAVEGTILSFSAIYINGKLAPNCTSESVSEENLPKAAEDIPEIGGFFLDANNRKIYYRLAEEETPKKLNAVVPLISQLCVFQGNEAKQRPVRNVRFYKIRFSGALPQENTPAISLHYAENCVFDRCTFEMLPEPWLNIAETCTGCEIR